MKMNTTALVPLYYEGLYNLLHMATVECVLTKVVWHDTVVYFLFSILNAYYYLQKIFITVF